MTHLLKTLTLTALLALTAPALAQGTITPQPLGGTLVIQSSETLRYTSDPLAGTLLLQNVRLQEGSTFPDGVTWRQRSDGIELRLPPGATFALTPDGKHLIVTPAAPPAAVDADDPLFVPLASGDPNTVAALVAQMFPTARVTVDPRQRALIIAAPTEERARVQRFVQVLDKARPQVMFEAEILEVNTDATQALGIQYDSIFSFKLTEGEAPGLWRLGGLSRNPLSISIGLNALKTNGAARVLAQPRITTLDGVEARINSTQTTPVIVPGANGTQSVQNITTGISLRMLPRVAPDGTVEANLSISVSAPTGTTSQGVPQFSSREATTTVRVANGEPIAIGGLLENRRVEGTSKVPILGDIPIIGRLFTTTRIETHHTDLVIVVTPRLVLSVNQPK